MRSDRSDAQRLRAIFMLKPAEWRALNDAAKDAHLSVVEYCRLMVLAAAGMGGVIEHLGRANDASFAASTGKQP